MKLVARELALTITALVVVPRANPWPTPPLDLDRLTAEASLIAVGEVMSVREVAQTTISLGDRTFNARAMTAELRVDQLLKGATKSASPFLTCHFVLPDEFIGWGSITPLSYRVFFLAESSGEFKLSDPYFPSVVAVPGTAVQEGNAIARVIDQVGAVLTSPNSSADQKREAVFVLSSSKTTSAVDALRRVPQMKDITLRLSVAAALLEHNDISTLTYAENELLKPDPALPAYLLHNLSYAISAGVKDDQAVPSLTRLLHASNTEVRRAAASALMHTGSISSVEPLLSSLNDPDFEVRYYSVVGLAEITGQSDWRPNMDVFMSDQKKYLDHWREWSRTR